MKWKPDLTTTLLAIVLAFVAYQNWVLFNLPADLRADITRIIQQEISIMDSLTEHVVTDSGRKIDVTVVRKENETDAELAARLKELAELVKDDNEQQPPP